VVNQEQVKEELRCRICLGILWEPRECKVCETCFCGPCLDRWLASGVATCPLKCSAEPEFKDRPHKVIRNMLAELTFHCKNSLCQARIEYPRVFEHERVCEFDLRECGGKAEGCQTVLPKG